MTLQKDTEKLDRLICKLLDQTITKDEHEKLESFLLESHANRLRYLELARCESMLHWEPSTMDLSDEISANSSKIVHFPVFAWCSSIAATLLALAGGWWAFIHEKMPETPLASHPVSSANHSSFNTNFSSVIEMDGARERKSIAPEGELVMVPSLREQTDAEALFGIDILESGNRFAEGGTYEFHGDLQRWNRISFLSRAAENGVLPASGSSMIGLDKMTVDVESQTAESSEMVQVVDVRKVLQLNPGEKASVSASVKFNQSFGDTQEGAEFGLTLHAFGSAQSGEEKKPLLRVEKSLMGDRDPRSWNQLTSEFDLPSGAEFVVVSLSAKKMGPDSLLANTSNYYCDDVVFSLTLGEKSTFGPI